MIPISEKEELALDKGMLVTKRDDFMFTIDKSTVICYGEIDFNDGSDDFEVIQGMNWLDHLGSLGVCVPSDYNYKEHFFLLLAFCRMPISYAKFYDDLKPIFDKITKENTSKTNNIFLWADSNSRKYFKMDYPFNPIILRIAKEYSNIFEVIISTPISISL